MQDNEKSWDPPEPYELNPDDFPPPPEPPPEFDFDTPFLGAVLNLLLMAQEMLAKAQLDVGEAVKAANAGNMDGAIGASINTPADLDTARSLVDAAMTLNRYRRRS